MHAHYSMFGAEILVIQVISTRVAYNTNCYLFIDFEYSAISSSRF